MRDRGLRQRVSEAGEEQRRRCGDVDLAREPSKNAGRRDPGHDRGRGRLVKALLAGALVVGLGCRGNKPAPAADQLAPLRAFETERRNSIDFAHAPPSDGALGPDPYAIVPLASGGFVGLLRGTDQIVRLDRELREIERVPAPAGASGLAVHGDELLAVGQRSGAITRLAIGATLDPRLPIALDPRPDGLRAGAAGDSETVYAVDEEGDRLYWSGGGAEGSAEICRAPFRLVRVDRWLVTACLVDHAIVAVPLGERGVPDVERAVRVTHDGPFWGFDATMEGDELVIAAGGVEDHPLDRTGGSFGYVDSFAFELRLRAGESKLREIKATNVSELGVVVPKAIAITSRGEALEALVTGAGSAKAAFIPLGGPAGASPRPIDFVPGASAVARVGDRYVFADPLLDAWVRFDGARVEVVPVRDVGPPRDAGARVGEALVFTTLIAPFNSSEGALSRFTCETCHFEGTVDGRVHATGRGKVVATTKPLLGLFENRPHFSRALDRDLSSVAENEFKVAGANSGHDPHFSIGPKEAPWLVHLGVDPDVELGPEALRKAFMAFFMGFSPRMSARTAGRAHFDDEEKRGAELFKQRCERCHEARLVTDVAPSRQPFEAWEGFVFAAEEPIVWATERYEKTGVEPYVHERGARVPSLRRLARKRPYFTNGTAKTLTDVLERARFDGDGFWHASGPDAAKTLDASERASLLAFLRLL